MRELSWIVNPEIDRAGAASPGQVAEQFERLVRATHTLWDAVPRDRLGAGDHLGLSPAWIVGHLSLLLRCVLESFGGRSSSGFPVAFGETFGPGRDGSAVQDAPEALLELFDSQAETLVAFLSGVDASRLLEPPRRDDFGLGAILPHDTLQGHATAALDYAGMYLMEMTLLDDRALEDDV